VGKGARGHCNRKRGGGQWWWKQAKGWAWTGENHVMAGRIWWRALQSRGGAGMGLGRWSWPRQSEVASWQQMIVTGEGGKLCWQRWPWPARTRMGSWQQAGHGQPGSKDNAILGCGVGATQWERRSQSDLVGWPEEIQIVGGRAAGGQGKEPRGRKTGAGSSREAEGDSRLQAGWGSWGGGPGGRGEQEQ